MVRAFVMLAVLLGGCRNSSDKSSSDPPDDPPEAPARAVPETKPSARVPGLRLDDPAWIPPQVAAEFWTKGEAACGDGATLRGAAPPRGTAIWCELPDGTRHGGYVEWHATQPGGERIASIGQHERGQRNGVWISYHQSGKKKAEQTYKAGKLHGMQGTYWPGGERESDGWYREGVPNGTFTAYDGTGGSGGSTVVRDGTGTIALVHENGAKRLEYHLVEGKRDGVETTYAAAGHKLSETTYRVGERHGPFTRWSAAGQVIERGTYASDMKEGNWIEFDDDGAEK
jgi:antitoxin component YwqK of YwqJK toxin-antitoxin module